MLVFIPSTLGLKLNSFPVTSYTILENWMSYREHKRQEHTSSLAQSFLELILRQHKFSLLLMQDCAFKEGHGARESLLIPSGSICISQQSHNPRKLLLVAPEALNSSAGQGGRLIFMIWYSNPLISPNSCGFFFSLKANIVIKTQ